MRALGMRVKVLDSPLRIISATGDCLEIVGACKLFMKTQVTGSGRKMIGEAAVLRGNKAEKELLVSLKSM